MSAIAAIYDAIEAWELTYDTDVFDTDSPIPCRDLDELKETGLKSGDAPIRMLSVPESAEFAFIGLGSSPASVDWIIVDTLYLKPVAQGEGIRVAAKKLRDYCGYYADKARLDRTPTAQSEVISISFTPRADLRWPEGSDVAYFGVECYITVREYIQT